MIKKLAEDTFSPCWMLQPDYHGKDYAFEAAKAFFDHLPGGSMPALRTTACPLSISVRNRVCAGGRVLCEGCQQQPDI